MIPLALAINIIIMEVLDGKVDMKEGYVIIEKLTRLAKIEKEE